MARCVALSKKCIFSVAMFTWMWFPGGVELGGTSSSGWAFRYQFGLDFSWSLSSRTSLGLNVRYAGTTDLNGGSSSSADFDAKSFQNLAMGITFSLAF